MISDALVELAASYRLEADRHEPGRRSVIRRQSRDIDQYGDEVLRGLHSDAAAAIWLDVARDVLAQHKLYRLDRENPKLANALRRALGND